MREHLHTRLLPVVGGKLVVLLHLRVLRHLLLYHLRVVMLMHGYRILITEDWHACRLSLVRLRLGIDWNLRWWHLALLGMRMREIESRGGH